MATEEPRETRNSALSAPQALQNLQLEASSAEPIRPPVPPEDLDKLCQEACESHIKPNSDQRDAEISKQVLSQLRTRKELQSYKVIVQTTSVTYDAGFYQQESNQTFQISSSVAHLWDTEKDSEYKFRFTSRSENMLLNQIVEIYFIRIN